MRMGITIKDALEFDYMSNAEVLAGEKGLKNIISNVNVMADPDVMKWVEGGELLLTTGYAFNKVDLEEQLNLISEAKQVGLAGIGIKIKPYLEKLPDKVLDMANSIDLPIIEIDENISISEITTPILKEIFDRQSSLLQRIENIYEQFMEAMLKSTDIEGLIRLTSKNIKNPVIANLDFPKKTIQELESVGKEFEEVLEKSVDYFYKDRYIRKEKKIHESKELLKDSLSDRVIIPIIANDSVYGHIFVWGINSPLGSYEMSVLEIASTTIALEVLKNLSVKEVENRYKSEFIEDLIADDYRRNKKSLDRVNFFNLKPNDLYFCVTIKLKDIVKKGNINENVTSMQQYLSRINEKLEKFIFNENINAIIGNKMDQVIILISFSQQNKNAEKLKLSEIIPKVREEVLSLEGFEARMGVGRTYIGIENFGKSYKDSISAVEIGKVLNDDKISIFSNLGIYQLLSQEGMESELESFYNRYLKKLVEYDEEKSTEMVKTLEAYFENNGNLKKMSDSLYTHYNTVLYRVQRITEITGIDLNNPESRLNLNVALKIKKLLMR